MKRRAGTLSGRDTVREKEAKGEKSGCEKKGRRGKGQVKEMRRGDEREEAKIWEMGRRENKKRGEDEMK